MSAQVPTLPALHPEAIYGCSTETDVTLWARGHVDKRRFKGRCIAGAKAGQFEGIEPYEIQPVLRGKVHHGWVFTIEGDYDGCGLGLTTHFTSSEPDPAGYETENYEGEEITLAYYDGPHEATWLETA